MSEELKDYVKKLREFDSLLKAKNDCQDFLSYISEERYIDGKLGKKPMKKDIVSVSAPNPANNGLLIASIIAVAVFILLTKLFFSNDSTVFLAILCLFASGGSIIAFIFALISTSDKKQEYNQELQAYNTVVAQNNKNNSYNTEEYQKELAIYNEKAAVLKIEYEKLFQEKKASLDTINNKLSDYDGFIPPKYYDGLTEIADIIEEGRAESVKEALNVYVSDCKQEELVRAQNRMNDIEVQKLQEYKQHNLRMEEQARQHDLRMEEAAQQQADAIRQQSDAIKNDARNREYQERQKASEINRWAYRCHGCKRYNSCNRDPVGCTFYQP